MINRILFYLSGLLPCYKIHLDCVPYLERYYVGKVWGVTFYLHRFLSGDTERHLHNHPWGWGRALVLAGSYMEASVIDICPHTGEVGCILRHRLVRWWNRVDGNSFHRISNAKRGTWTLFFHGPRLDMDGDPVIGLRGAVRMKGWGFLHREGDTTVFRQYPSAKREWWLTDAVGRDAGRVPL